MRCGRFEGHSRSRGSDSLVNLRQSTEPYGDYPKCSFVAFSLGHPSIPTVLFLRHRVAVLVLLNAVL